MFLQLDGTVVVQIVNFIVFLVILNAVFLKPVGSAIARRRAHINDVLSKDAEYTSESASIRAMAAERRAQARRSADEAVVQARLSASVEADRLVAEAAAHAAEVVERAHATVADEVRAAQAQEERVVADLAASLLTHVIPAEAAA